MPILLIDSYDSFTCNLVELVERSTGEKVVTIRNDAVSAKELINEVLPAFDAVVVGPGPGSPDNPSDIGVIPMLWKLPKGQLKPVLGVCLGMQSLVSAFGGEIAKLPHPKHGQPGNIIQNELAKDSIFENIPAAGFESIRYHSLYATNDLPENIVKLAYCQDDDGTEIVMAVKHAYLPLYGVQYHPESICSDFGTELVQNFWSLTKNSNPATIPVPRYIHDLSHPEPLFKEENLSEVVPHFKLKRWDVGEATSFDIAQHLKKTSGEEVMFLDSSASPGQFSIIGVPETGASSTITFLAQQAYIGKWGEPNSKQRVQQKDVWKVISEYFTPKIKAYHDILENSILPENVPFIGGLLGYIGYDPYEVSDTPTVSLVDVEHTVLIDTLSKQVYVMSLKDDSWVDTIVATRATVLNKSVDLPRIENVTLPQRSEYIDKISQCQKFLHSGDSYELCLTAQTSIEFSDSVDAWGLYSLLSKHNPAPYSCIMQLEDATILGASPERFMHWSKQSRCEFRPIKGTVKKTPQVTKEMATSLLNTPKERGENLMIVDLIRHDLNQILSDVRVDKLMVVEEYEKVYQLVSVISGDLSGTEYHGIDLLAHSLPPGSMTGAPKIRSVEILKDLESPVSRGIYSGVMGYWSVTDSGDWSVIIRSAFSYTKDPKTWFIGAGGAITVLSKAEEEWDEMITKLETALKAFVP